MTIRQTVVAAFVFAALAGPAWPQSPPAPVPAAPAQPAPPASAPPVTDWSTAPAEEVTVSARIPGPPLWHVHNKDADLWILGIVFPVPKDLDWDKYRVKDILQRARTVYLPPAVSIGLLDAGWFMLTQMDTIKQPQGVTLDETLPADLRTRLEAWRDKLKKRRGDEYLGSIAAWDFEQSFRKRFQLNGKTLDSQLAEMAEAAHASAEPIFKVSGAPVVYEMRKLPREAQNECVRAAVDDMDAQSVHALAAAKAWAAGDLAGIKANYSEAELFDCLDHSKTAAAARARLIGESEKVAKSALSGHDTTLLVVNMGAVLRKGGLIDRLTADGYQITAPHE